MDFDKLYPNRFLKAGEFDGRSVTLTIAKVRIEELEGDKGKQKKAILEFSETPKHLVLNKTNGVCLKAMFGRETDAWVGKRVTFHPAQIVDSFTKETIPAIRVKGSPDIVADKAFSAKIGRKTVDMKVFRTGKGAPSKPQLAPAPSAPADDAPPPITDDEIAEIAARENGAA